ncbi:MAG: hypothetical protein ACAI25_12770 [Planctomycetota bacterium]
MDDRRALLARDDDEVLGDEVRVAEAAARAPVLLAADEDAARDEERRREAREDRRDRIEVGAARARDDDLERAPLDLVIREERSAAIAPVHDDRGGGARSAVHDDRPAAVSPTAVTVTTAHEDATAGGEQTEEREGDAGAVEHGFLVLSDSSYVDQGARAR